MALQPNGSPGSYLTSEKDSAGEAEAVQRTCGHPGKALVGGASLARPAHQVGLWSGVLNAGYSGVQVVNPRTRERLPASGQLEERGQKQGR